MVCKYAISKVDNDKTDYRSIDRIYLLADFHPAFIPLLQHFTKDGGLEQRFGIRLTLVHCKPLRSSHPVLSAVECLKYPFVVEPADFSTLKAATMPSSASTTSTNTPVTSRTTSRRKPGVLVEDPVVFVGLLQTMYDKTIQTGQAYQPMAKICADFSAKCDFRQLGFRKFKHMMEEAARHGLVAFPIDGDDEHKQQQQQNHSTGDNNSCLTAKGYMTLLTNGGGNLFAESPPTAQQRKERRAVVLSHSPAQFHPLLFAMFDQSARIWQSGSWIDRASIQSILRPFIGPLTDQYIAMAVEAGVVVNVASPAPCLAISPSTLLLKV